MRSLAALEPPPAEVLAVDGGSADASVAIAEAAGLLVVRHDTRGRAAAINRGVQEATAPIICVLHADTLLPDDAVAVMRRVLADPGTALAGFTPLLSGPDQVHWGTSFHNWIKTWYAPLVFRPQLFLHGLRLLFGDDATFSAAPISWPSAAATPRCWSWRRLICASASTGSAEPASSTAW